MPTLKHPPNCTHRSHAVWRVVEGDNHGGDYPNESFVNLPPTTRDAAEVIAAVINQAFCKDDQALRYWRVEHQDYKLQPGFEL